jgi:hypothetical protein
MQAGASLDEWMNGSTHNIPVAELRQVFDSWKLLFTGSTEREVLDAHKLKYAKQWAPINRVFANDVSFAARLVASRGTQPFIVHAPLSCCPLCVLCWQDYTLHVREAHRGLFTPGAIEMKGHPVSDTVLSSELACFRSLCSKFKAYALRLHPTLPCH